MKSLQRKLTPAEKGTLLELVVSAIASGEYSGNKEQHYARLKRLLEWVRRLP